MFRIIWLLFIAIIITTPLVWLLDHNGSVVINWLDYEIKTDMVTAIIIAAIFTIFIAFLSYITTRLLTISLPSIINAIFNRRERQKKKIS